MATLTARSSTIDLFSDEVLADPYPAYAELRSQGGCCYLERYGLVCLPRYGEVRETLRDWQTFSSAEGTAIDPESNRLRKGNIISTDPPEHDVLRKVLADQLGPRAVRRLGEEIDQRADGLVAGLVERGHFDAVSDLSKALPIEVVCDLVGFPPDGREELQELAHASFNTFGPMNERARESMPMLAAIWTYLERRASRGTLAEGSVGEAIYLAADAGHIRPDQVRPLLFAFASAGIDTTVNAIGNALYLLGNDPPSWKRLREDPSLIPSAFNEALRTESPIQYFTRFVHHDVEIDGVAVPAGERVCVIFGSANRDPAKWQDPDRFVVDRNPSDHVAFGYGVHGCLGQVLARLEGHAVLGALVRRAITISAGEPTRHLHNILRGLEHLPFSIEAP